jgi:hypothetical protein
MVAAMADALFSRYQLMTDPRLLGQVLGNETFAAHHVIAKLVDGLPLTDSETSLAQQLTGRSQFVADDPVSEIVAIAGRRSAKTSGLLSPFVIHAACCQSFRLSPGEQGVALLLAPGKVQAQVARRYVLGQLHSSPVLAAMIVNERADDIELSNGHAIRVAASDYRTTRGFSAICVAIDEACFLPTGESAASPDEELIAALAPSLATTGGKLLIASSPYARRGAAWERHRAHFGRDRDPILVTQAASRLMNPTLPQAVVDEALARDPATARAEWLGEFRADVETFVSLDAVDAVTDRGVFEREPAPGVRYVAFADPSGGSSDSFTLGIAHQDAKAGAAVLDLVREIRPPFSPEAAVADLAGALKRFRLTRVTSDRYAGEWPVEQWRKHGIHCATSERTRSEIYGALLPALNSGRVRLLDHARMRAQLIGLERRTARGGRDTVDHGRGPGQHDDVINAAAGALVLASAAQTMPVGIAAAWEE